MKVWIGKDEWYPVAFISERQLNSAALEVDIPDELVARFRKAVSEFDGANREVVGYLELAEKEARQSRAAANVNRMRESD